MGGSGLGSGVLRAKQLTRTLGVLLIVTGLINSGIFFFGAAGGQIVQGTLWLLIGWSFYQAKQTYLTTF